MNIQINLLSNSLENLKINLISFNVQAVNSMEFAAFLYYRLQSDKMKQLFHGQKLGKGNMNHKETCEDRLSAGEK